MALPVLDGNQSATTLSSVVTGGEHIVAHTVVSLGSTAISNITSAVSGVTIAGTVTANVVGQDEFGSAQPIPLIETDGPNNVTRELAVSSIIIDNDGYSIFNTSDGSLGIPIAARRFGVPGAIDYITAENNRLDTNVKNSVTIGSLPAISGTVTVGAMPNGTLTTRFGTPTTANTAFATSAVTNTSRKYLLIQNVTTGSNVITVGIGFTPTTTQGIQLTAGAGITFESSYIPTGAVYVLSSVTASNFTILEA